MVIAGALALVSAMSGGDTVQVSPDGKRKGTVTLSQALRSRAKTIVVHSGRYEFFHFETIASTVTIKAAQGEKVIFSGAVKVDATWTPEAGGIWRFPLNNGKLSANRLWLNGQLLQRARYPDFDAGARYLNGTAKDALSPERVARWKNPKTGLIHSMHQGLWGDEWFKIEGVNADGTAQLSAPIGNNRPSGVHPELRYVENIREELDAPGEWFEENGTLYVIPPQGIDIQKAQLEVAATDVMFIVRGEKDRPVKGVRFEGITFEKSGSTFLHTTEPLLRSDWQIARMGAVMLWATENCSFVDCDFQDLGGNAVFVSGQNKGVSLDRCHFRDIGASAVCFVGNPKSVRTPLYSYGERLSFNQIDSNPGPSSDDYPVDCLVNDCLIERVGRVEKQSAGVQISMARRISVKNTTIHDCPRAGINIGDGCWGGHLIEGCDVFDTVRETSDHGAFNSWGRDRYWGVDFKGLPMPPDMPKWDAMETTILRGNRWQCAHGWDIDLDDGSSNYLIENNLCLEGGLKLREGYFRIARNNILVENGLHLHVWYPNSRDVVERNLTWRGHAGPVGMPEKWGDSVDYNFVHRAGSGVGPATQMQSISHADPHSLVGDAGFMDAAGGDWRLNPGSPVLKTGFKPFPLDRFGVQHGRLREAARRAFVNRPQKTGVASALDHQEYSMLGGRVKNLSGISEVSATGMQSETGVLVVESPSGSPLARLGLQRNDVLLSWDGRTISRIKDLESAVKTSPRPRTIVVWRGQSRQEVHPSS